jgi:hypothetical protein
VVQVKIQNLSLAVLLCFYVIFAFSINPFMDDFPGMSIEVTDQNNEGVFSSLSRNFEQTIEEINTADEKNPTSTSTSTDSSNTDDEKITASDVPAATSEPSNLISSNSTTTDDLGKKNQTDFSN